MMKRILACILTVGLLLLSLTACQTEQSDLVFYVIKAEDLPADAAESTLLSIAKEQGRVAFTGAEIERWHWEEQQVDLKEPNVRGGSGNTGSSLFQADAEDAFLLALGNEVLYFGGFKNDVGAMTLDRDPYIADLSTGTAFSLRCHHTYEAGEDPRRNDTLYDFLASFNLLASDS